MSFDLIERHADTIDWELLSENTAIPWTLDFCIRFEDRIHWKKLNPMGSPALHGRENTENLVQFLDRFKDRLDWEVVCDDLWDPSHPEEFLARYEKWLRWDRISLNETIEWNFSIMYRFRKQLDWFSLAVNKNVLWEPDWMEIFRDYIDWDWFFTYASVQWTEDLIEKYRDRWKAAGVKREFFGFSNLLQRAFREDKEKDDLGEEAKEERIYDEYGGYLESDGGYYYKEGLIRYPPTSLNEVKRMIGEYRENLEEINNEEFELVWTEDSFEYILSLPLDERVIQHLSSTSSFEDPHLMLRRFRNRLVWGGLFPVRRSSNDDNPEYFTYPGGVSASRQFFWTEEMLDEFRELIHWDIISERGIFRWTPSLLKRFFPLFNKELLVDNKFLWPELILPEMNDFVIEIVMGTGRWS
ncbi:MAG: hypothetical protein IH594_05465 [Bacteroidales bacterium]|nr:hypothetical protein [Bacteroidales bacterium]